MTTGNLRRVLIIDDNVDLAENIAEILQMDGHATDVAASAEEAFPKAALAEPDVVVTDYRLPGITGAAFVRRVPADVHDMSARWSSAPTPTTAPIKEARDAGATFMPKPVDFKLLVRMIRYGAA